MAKAEAELLEDDQNDDLDVMELDEQEDQDVDQLDDPKADDQDDEENEIVLEGDGDEVAPHEQDEQRGIRKRINKLNAKVAEATGNEQSAAESLEIERERNRLLQAALDERQAPQPVDGPPDPNDFDDGVSDRGYIAAFQNHIAKGVREEVLQAQQTTQVQTKASSQLQERQIAHYKKADALKVKDFDATEDVAIAALGQEVVNQIIGASDKSPELLYHLGKNPAKAEALAEMIRTNPVKGVLEMGRLEARLISRPKAHRNAPDPDESLAGGGSGSPRTSRGPKGATFE